MDPIGQVNCPSWEYRLHPDSPRVLPLQSETILLALRRGQIDTLATSTNTRPIHSRLFEALVPAGFGYYAGHYRGEDFPCLKNRFVTVRSDPRVGFPPNLVYPAMVDLEESIRQGIAALDAAQNLPAGQIPDQQKTGYAIAVVASLFERFLTIHPYLNGNGHCARFLAIALLGHHGRWIQRWSISPGPTRPAKDEMNHFLSEYRTGRPEGLEGFLAQSLMP